ncbi:MAG TPA: hypothetical protein VKQ72_03960 [Aggregatilineales bacterium]|nr:hypothetical protein [Aggregatilineales bacterium]
MLASLFCGLRHLARASLFHFACAPYNSGMSTELNVEGLESTAEQIAAVQAGLNDALQEGLRDAMQPIRDAVSTYPPVPPYVGSGGRGGRGGPAHHKPHPYARTGAYGSSVTPVQVEGDGSEVSGYFATPAPYAIYLRGTPDGSYGGAWMHTPYWQSLKSILDALLPEATDVLQRGVDDFISRVMGG